MKMKRIILTLTMLVALVATASAQAEIKFDKLIHNFGSFEESNPVQKATFTFTNVGNKPLIINQAIASCGCTVPSYTKKPVAPGEKGQISVTYNGKGMFPGHFTHQMTMRKWLLTLLLKHHCKLYMNQRVFGIPMLTTNKAAYQRETF